MISARDGVNSSTSALGSHQQEVNLPPVAEHRNSGNHGNNGDAKSVRADQEGYVANNDGGVGGSAAKYICLEALCSTVSSSGSQLVATMD